MASDEKLENNSDSVKEEEEENEAENAKDEAENSDEEAEIKVVLPPSMLLSRECRLSLGQPLGMGAVVLAEEGELRHIKVAQRCLKERLEQLPQVTAVCEVLTEMNLTGF